MLITYNLKEFKLYRGLACEKCVALRNGMEIKLIVKGDK